MDISVMVKRVQSRLDEAREFHTKYNEIFEQNYDGLVESILNDDIDLGVAIKSIQESISLEEAIVKHVDSTGQVTRKKDRKTRSRLAFQTTGISRAKRREIARRAAKTKRANPSIKIKALRKTKRALRKRKALGL